MTFRDKSTVVRAWCTCTVAYWNATS